MSKKLTLLVTLIALLALGTNAQTVDELKAELAEKTAALGVLQGEVNGLKGQIANFPGWKVGALATIGFNSNSFSKWLASANPNASSTTFGITGNAFANLDQDKYFWRNSLSIAASKTKLVTDTDVDDALPEDLQAEFETTADAINITSLFGYKIAPKWAISGLAEYRSTFLTNFNNPGFLDIGVGATWTPISNLVVVIHPLNYNIVFAKDEFTYEPSLGAKIVADYTQSLPMGVAWRSNLSAFVSYSDPNNFSNWTWVNGFNFTAWKGIGVGVELGLRGNRQESYNSFLTAAKILDPTTTISAETVEISDFEDQANADNPIQSYFVIGLTYNISR